MVGFWKKTKCLDLSENTLTVEEMGPKDLELEGRKVMAGKAKETTAVEVAEEEAAVVVVNTTMEVAASAGKEVGVEVAAKGMGTQVAAAAAEMVSKRSVANEEMEMMVVVAPPVVSMAMAAEGKGMPAEVEMVV